MEIEGSTATWVISAEEEVGVLVVEIVELKVLSETFSKVMLSYETTTCLVKQTESIH